MDNPFFEILEPRLLLSADLLCVAGDANLDRRVDWNDLQTLQANFGQTNATWDQGDFNDDNIINAFDYISLKRNMGHINTFSAVIEADSLIISGTAENDLMEISQVGDDIVFMDRVLSGDYNNVVVNSLDGNDIVRIDYSVLKDMQVFAGNGDDKVYENGQCPATVNGEDGEDLLVTVGGGADLIFGGNEKDSFWFDSFDVLFDASVNEELTKSIHDITEFVSPFEDEIVSKEINGQNFQDPITSYPYQTDYSSYSLFGESPLYNDIRQGYIGDCYFMAVLSSLAHTDLDILKQAITELGDGTYAVRYITSHNGEEFYYRIDGELPGYGYPRYARIVNNKIWVPLMEKAYCFFRYGQNSYASLAGGWMTSVYPQITGGAVGNGQLYEYKTNKNYVDMVNMIQEYIDAGHSLSIATGSDSPIVSNHAYVILSAEETASGCFITIYNPWGSSSRLTAEFFLEAFYPYFTISMF